VLNLDAQSSLKVIAMMRDIQFGRQRGGSIFNILPYIEESSISIAQIADGSSNTYFAGEKHLNSNHYTTGMDPADNETWCTGWNNDNYRLAGTRKPGQECTEESHLKPIPDTPGYGDAFRFGSAHPTEFHVVLGDGSASGISYDVDSETHRRLANRGDGLTIGSDSL